MAKHAVAVLGEAIRAAAGGNSAGLNDRELLRRFAAGDQDAFAVLFRRHAGMVLGVCQRGLPCIQDAEDACQAAFLLLSRKAASGRWQQSVANWLYLTARRVAHNARVAAQRRARREGRVAVPDAVQPVDRMTGRELLDALYAELDRLQPTYREPLVLCYLEGLTRDEAATRLGLTAGAVKIRLERARKHLSDALTRRGFALGAGLLALAATSPARATPLRLVDAVLANAAGSPPAGVARLAGGAAAKGLSKKSWLLILFLIGAGVINLAGAALAPPAANSPAEKQPLPQPDTTAKAPEAQAPIFTGRVLDPAGKPVAGARLILSTGNRPSTNDAVEVAVTAADGTFRCTINPLKAGEPDSRTLFAHASGFAADWVNVSELTAEKRATFHLVADDIPVHGRLLGLEGNPVSGAQVTVTSIRKTATGTPDAAFALWQTDPGRAFDQPTKDASHPACAGVPTQVLADKDGRFEIKGAGRGRLLNLHFEANGIETTDATVVIVPAFDPKSVRAKPGLRSMSKTASNALYGPEFTYIAKPDAVIKGVVTDARTGKPIAGVRIAGTDAETGWHVFTETDVDGHYRLSGVAKAARRRILVFPGKESPYLEAGLVVHDVPGLSDTTVDVRLTRGVLVQGSVIDKVSGKPVPDAAIRYAPLSGNPYFAKTPGTDIYKWVLDWVSSDANGVFRLVVLPGDGLIHAQDGGHGPTLLARYKQVRVDPADKPRIVKEVRAGLGDAFLSASGMRLSLQNQAAYKIIDPAEGADSVNVELQFDPGRPVSGKVVDPDGKPAAGIVAYGLTAEYSHPATLKDGTFTAVGLEPAQPRTVVFADAARKLSGAVRLRGDEKEPPIVKLQAWAAVTGRVVDAGGSPCAGLVVSHTVAEGDGYARYQLAKNGLEAKTGTDGAFQLDIPFAGVAFRLGFQSSGQVIETPKALDGLKVLPGETKDLGEITIKSE
jgi:RNA polymerase sigma factor (sigma-70 family)